MMANAAALPQSSGDRLLDELVAVYPYASGYTMTSTPDGYDLYAGEGGAVAVIHSDHTATNYNTPLKRDPVGSVGVLPVKMLLDPDITATPGPAYCPAYEDNDLLYVAGGRDGLWAMQADVQHPGQPNLAVRIDDATSKTSTQHQNSRRWCNDLDYVTLEEGGEQVTYLVALFGAKNDSRLRLYKLDDVRDAANAALDASVETGHEINPEKSVRIQWHLSPGAAGNGHSFAFGMDVDDENDHVYVAIGFHGLVRIRLDQLGSGFFNNPPIEPYCLEWGPYCGDSSHYVTIDPNLYKNVKFYDGAELVTDYPPPFLDVAVDRTDPEDPWVYAAVDHVGLVGFSLSGEWNDHIEDETNPPMKRFHQEGESDNDGPLHWSELVLESQQYRCSTFARRVQVVESAKALLVSTVPTPAMKHPAILTMSRTMSFDQTMLGMLPGEADWTRFVGEIRHGYTLAYDLENRGSWVSGLRNTAAIADMGRQMHGPPIQTSGKLTFFAGGDSDALRLVEPEREAAWNQLDLFHVEFDGWPPTPPAVLTTYSEWVREKDHRTGRWVYRVGLNAANPEVLATGSNQGGMVSNAPLVFDLTQPGGAKIIPKFDPGPNALPTARPQRTDGENGVLFEPDAGYAEPAGSLPGANEYRFGMRRWDSGSPDGLVMRWRLAKMYGGYDVTSPSGARAPYQEKAVFFTAPEDQFLSRGYYQYSGAGYSPEYNQEKQVNYLFASVFQSPQGIRVLDLDNLVDYIDSDTDTDDGEMKDLEFWPEFPTDPQVMVGELTTHPEFWHVPECRDGASYVTEAEGFIDRGTPFDGKVRTMPPQFIKLPSGGGGNPADTWVLVVPCGYVGCDNTLLMFQNDPYKDWIPEADFRVGAGYSRLMVRFFNINTPGDINEYHDENTVGSHMIPAYTLIGPDENSSAMFLRTLHLDLEGNDDRYFCFVADLGGHMYVYEITDLLTFPTDFSQDGDPPLGIKSHIHYGATLDDTELAPFATYEPPDCLADDQISNIWDVEVDAAHWWEDEIEHNEVYVYVSVQREGVQVLRLDVDAGTPEDRLVPVKLIQTPGETSFLYLVDVPDESVLGTIDDAHHDYIREKLLFVPDAIAGFRIYTYPELGSE